MHQTLMAIAFATLAFDYLSTTDIGTEKSPILSSLKMSKLGAQTRPIYFATQDNDCGIFLGNAH